MSDLLDLSKKELSDLRAFAEKAKEVIGFYGGKENYECEDISRTTGNKVFDILTFDFDRNLEPKKDYAGRRAREIQSSDIWKRVFK